MSESQIIERSPTATVIRTGNNGQRLTIPNSLPILPIRNIVSEFGKIGRAHV